MQYSNQPADQPERDPLVDDLRALLDQPPTPVVDRNVRQAYRTMLGNVKPSEPQKPGLWQQLSEVVVSQYRGLVFSSVAVSLLLGCVTGLLLPTLWQSSEPDHAVVADILQTRGASPSMAVSSQQAMPAEEWLESIAELLLQGHISEARKQLAQFEARYPEPVFTQQK